MRLDSSFWSNFKLSIKGANSYFRYPQYVMAQEAAKIVRTLPDIENRTVVDAPCGDGIITYWLRKKYPKQQMELYDISDELILRAKELLRGVMIRKQDIFDLDVDKGHDVWLLINSLFCLPDKEKLVKRTSPRMEYIIGIFPYLEHANYEYFMKNYRTFSNPGAMSRSETISLFGQYGYQVVFCKDIIHFCFYRYSSNRYLNRLMTTVLNPIDRFNSNKSSGAYWIALFKRCSPT